MEAIMPGQLLILPNKDITVGLLDEGTSGSMFGKWLNKILETGQKCH
jgi:hypothetical protein